MIIIILYIRKSKTLFVIHGKTYWLVYHFQPTPISKKPHLRTWLIQLNFWVCFIQYLVYNSAHTTDLSVFMSSLPSSTQIPQASWQSGRAGRHKATGLHAALKSAPGKRVMATVSYVSLRHGLFILETSLPRWQPSVGKSIQPACQIQGQDR